MVGKICAGLIVADSAAAGKHAAECYQNVKSNFIRKKGLIFRNFVLK
ncbi:hypothetical protein ANACOL_01649 [Anaerotruncus colihominis DSM 17241]|jgi:hypothetical protein|uniref:Uncharacterized protein n=1 Tax=Anaerotruncus colihominis DSM 17241 TaxID=445972 RepID=B0PA80_9FIRM|nr:hypothetical protein [Anaerotruncus colihominis]EDS11758.1 hypothetical protein ANACOL_01649 [Anaerotruncus colihominis DSM 17241]